jgi:SSS family solute:Na+ symporter
MTLLTFLFFTGLVAVVTWRITHKDDHHSSTGYFLAGRSLTWPFIAGSLLLTNLSTEQMVGLNGSAYKDGLLVMAWEVVAVVALVTAALFFLPKFLRSGISTVPELLELRFDAQTRAFCSILFLVAYAVILLPIILYTGATGLIGMLDLSAIIGVSDYDTLLWLVVWLVGLLGSVYALFGGLRTVVVSDTLNGIGLLIGGLLIAWLGLSELGEGSVGVGLQVVAEANPGRLSSNGSESSSVPFSTLFSGVLLLHMFYWTTNQQIIQRTLGAKSLAEGQKGIMATGFLKLFGPLYLVLPGLIAYAMFPDLGSADQAYGTLVSNVLPDTLIGFFAAVMVGAILSSYNSALNSTCTLFSLGVYQRLIAPEASGERVVAAGKKFGWVVSVIAMIGAPLLAGQSSIFNYLQQMNGLYFIPILAVVFCGLISRRMPAISAKVTLIVGPAGIAIVYFVPVVSQQLAWLHEYHFLGLMFVALCLLMLALRLLRPLKEDWVQPDAEVVDMTPWAYVGLSGLALLLAVLGIYSLFYQ